MRCVKVGPWTTEMSGKRTGRVYPRGGQDFTIREIVLNEEGRIFFLLIEIKNDLILHKGTLQETRFFSGHFRPIRQTDISIFKALLVKPPKVRADA